MGAPIENYSQTPPGWYDDGSGKIRHWDGQRWGQYAPEPVTVVEGPNHVLHAVLSLLTFPLCGCWLWVWLVVALNNKKTVRRL